MSEIIHNNPIQTVDKSKEYNADILEQENAEKKEALNENLKLIGLIAAFAVVIALYFANKAYQKVNGLDNPAAAPAPNPQTAPSGTAPTTAPAATPSGVASGKTGTEPKKGTETKDDTTTTENKSLKDKVKDASINF